MQEHARAITAFAAKASAYSQPEHRALEIVVGQLARDSAERGERQLVPAQEAVGGGWGAPIC